MLLVFQRLWNLSKTPVVRVLCIISINLMSCLHRTNYNKSDNFTVGLNQRIGAILDDNEKYTKRQTWFEDTSK